MRYVGGLVVPAFRSANQFLSDEKGLSAIKLQHNKECKGLMVQIRYLKAKYTRETGFRCDLGYQKQYLLTLLSMFERRLVDSVFVPISLLSRGFTASKPSLLHWHA
jgi:myosin protein heavy chain